ncbi:MAG: YdeI/OmpD-associated family protein [Acidobacteriota bacterium]
MKATAHLLPAVDAYIAKAPAFAQPILERLREAVHAAVPDVEEAIKWSMPFFMYKGIILANMAAFKQHASFGIWKENVQPLMKPNVEKRGKNGDGGGGMGSFGKLTDLKDLPTKAALKQVLVEAARKIDTGERDKNWSRPPKAAKPEAEVPASLAAALKKNKAAATGFKAMTPSCRREYCEWITEAKREETRDKRVATAVEWIAEGKSRNWKYQNC